MPLVVLMLAAVLAIYPIVLQPRSRIIGWLGDNVQYAYMTGWTAQALWLNQSPLVDPRLNYPQSLVLTATDAPFLSMLAVAPATLLLGPTFGYNLIIYLSFLLSGLIVYLWVVKTTNNRFGGIIAGLVFLLTPYRVVHSYGHLQLVSTQTLPLFFWALDSASDHSVPSWRNLLLLAGATFLVGSMAQYYLFISLLLGVVYTLLIIAPRWAYLVRYGYWLVLSVGLGAVLSAAIYLITWNDALYVPYNILETRVWSASLLDFVVPSRLHPLWGTFVEQAYPRSTWIEHTLYLGIVACGLALVALGWRESPYRRRNRVWAGVILVAIVCALGTDLHMNGQPLQGDDPFWLPAYYLGQFPFMNLMRTWARFSIIAILFVALLAGVGASQLIARFHRRRWIVGTACVLLLLLDFSPGRLEHSRLEARPVDRWLAAQPGDFAVAFLPPGHGNYEAMFGSLFHGKHLPAFNHPQHQPAAFTDFAERAAGFPDAQSIKALQEIRLRYLIVDRRLFTGQDRADWPTVEVALAASPDVQVIENRAPFMIIALNAPDRMQR